MRNLLVLFFIVLSMNLFSGTYTVRYNKNYKYVNGYHSNEVFNVGDTLKLSTNKYSIYPTFSNYGWSNRVGIVYEYNQDFSSPTISSLTTRSNTIVDVFPIWRNNTNVSDNVSYSYKLENGFYRGPSPMWAFDPDNDGFSSYEEYVWGSDPFNIDSYPDTVLPISFEYSGNLNPSAFNVVIKHGDFSTVSPLIEIGKTNFTRSTVFLKIRNVDYAKENFWCFLDTNGDGEYQITEPAGCCYGDKMIVKNKFYYNPIKIILCDSSKQKGLRIDLTNWEIASSPWYVRSNDSVNGVQLIMGDVIKIYRTKVFTSSFVSTYKYFTYLGRNYICEADVTENGKHIFDDLSSISNPESVNTIHYDCKLNGTAGATNGTYIYTILGYPRYTASLANTTTSADISNSSFNKVTLVWNNSANDYISHFRVTVKRGAVVYYQDSDVFVPYSSMSGALYSYTYELPYLFPSYPLFNSVDNGYTYTIESYISTTVYDTATAAKSILYGFVEDFSLNNLGKIFINCKYKGTNSFATLKTLGVNVYKDNYLSVPPTASFTNGFTYSQVTNLSLSVTNAYVGGLNGRYYIECWFDSNLNGVRDSSEFFGVYKDNDVESNLLPVNIDYYQQSAFIPIYIYDNP